MMTEQKSTFQGDRGGDAYDAELLALLQGVSANSGAADRFAGGDDDGSGNGDTAPTEPEPQSEPEPKPAPVSSPTKPARRRISRDPNKVPPWKRGKAGPSSKTKASLGRDIDIVIATPSPRP